jgi:hypothetical protein
VLPGGRWLGALAEEAQKDFPTVGAAVAEWEKITGQNAMDEGCNCCGAPHTFYWGCAVDTDDCGCKGPHKDYGYASGEQLSQHIFSRSVPTDLRSAIEEIERLKSNPRRQPRKKAGRKGA